MTQELLDRVYSLTSVHQHWSSVRTHIDELQARVDVWFSSLPPEVDFTRVQDGDQAHGEKMGLVFQYHSARIMLGRPCLCRHNTSQRGSDEDQHFTHTMAVSALKSATQMANLIPDGPNTDRSHGARPWWCLLHYVMQAATVISLNFRLVVSTCLRRRAVCCSWPRSVSGGFTERPSIVSLHIEHGNYVTVRSAGWRCPWDSMSAAYPRIPIGKGDTKDMPSPSIMR